MNVIIPSHSFDVRNPGTSSIRSLSTRIDVTKVTVKTEHTAQFAVCSHSTKSHRYKGIVVRVEGSGPYLMRFTRSCS